MGKTTSEIRIEHLEDASQAFQGFNAGDRDGLVILCKSDAVLVPGPSQVDTPSMIETFAC